MEALEAKRGGGGEDGETTPSPRMFRDIRRYYCEFCGICRSKKSLIAPHVFSQDQDEIGDAIASGDVRRSVAPASGSPLICGSTCRATPSRLRVFNDENYLKTPYCMA